MGNSTSAAEQASKAADEKEKIIDDFEDEFGSSRILVRSTSFSEEQPILDAGVGMDSSHGVLRRVYVNVPKGVKTGQYFTVHVNGQDLEVMCPPVYSRISNRVVVELPIDSNPALMARNLPELTVITQPNPFQSVTSKKDQSDRACSSKTFSDNGKSAAAATPSTLKPQRFYVTVPKGARTGKYFPVHVHGQHLMVKCPPAYSRISDRFVIEVPHDILMEDEVVPGQEPEVYIRGSRRNSIVSDGEQSDGRSENGPAKSLPDAVTPADTVGHRPRVNSNPETSTHPPGLIVDAGTSSVATGTEKAAAVGNKKVERVYVRIPKGTRSGQFFTVHVRGNEVKVRCPPAYSRISDRVLVEVPLHPSPAEGMMVAEVLVQGSQAGIRGHSEYTHDEHTSRVVTGSHAVPISALNADEKQDARMTGCMAGAPLPSLSLDENVLGLSPSLARPCGRATKSVQSAPDEISLETVGASGVCDGVAASGRRGGADVADSVLFSSRSSILRSSGASTATAAGKSMLGGSNQKRNKGKAGDKSELLKDSE